MLENNGEMMSNILFGLVMLVCFLAYKLRWQDSTFCFALAAVSLLGALSKLLVLMGPESKIPVFLFAYLFTAVVCTVVGLFDLRRERRERDPTVLDATVVPNWSNAGIHDDDRFRHG